MAKRKVVKAKVSRLKKRMSKGVVYPFQVWSLVRGGFHELRASVLSRKDAEHFIQHPGDFGDLIAPVILEIPIKPMEY